MKSPIRVMVIWALAASVVLSAQSRLVPTPETTFGFKPGADYKLATYEAIDSYLEALDGASDRMAMIEIGRSVEGRPLRLIAITSPQNMARLDRFKAIAAALATTRDARGQPVDETAARALAREGRAIVWVDFGLHSSEVAHAQAAPLFVWRMVNGESAEVRRLRDEVVLLVMPNMNPDGTTKVAEWYKTLDLQPGADMAQIKSSYRQLMRKYHPDMHAGNPQKQKAATELSMRVTTAYNSLVDHLEKK